MKDDGRAIYVDSDPTLALSPDKTDRTTLAWSALGGFEDNLLSSVRLHHVMNLADPRKKGGSKAAFASTKLSKSAFLEEEYSHALEGFDDSVKAARKGKWLPAALPGILKKTRLHHRMFETVSHDGKEAPLSQSLKILNSIGVLALHLVHRYLFGVSEWSMEGRKIMVRLAHELEDLYDNPDKPLFLGSEPTQLLAQSALDWLSKHGDNSFSPSMHLLKPAVSQVSLVTSPLTEFPRTHSPAISKASELSKFSSDMIRPCSLVAQRDLLGESIELRYNPFLSGASLYTEYGLLYSREIGLRELLLTIEGVEALLATRNWPKVKDWIEAAGASMGEMALEQWKDRLSEVEDLDEALRFCTDYVHCIGFMEPDSGTMDDDVIMELVGRLLHYSVQSAIWISKESLFEQLEAAAELAKASPAPDPSLEGKLEDIWNSPSRKLAERDPERFHRLLGRYIGDWNKEAHPYGGPTQVDLKERVAEILRSECLKPKEKGVTVGAILRLLGENDTERYQKRTRKAKQIDIDEGRSVSLKAEITVDERISMPPRSSILQNWVNKYNDEKHKVHGKDKTLVIAAHPAYQELVKLFPEVSRKQITEHGVKYWVCKGGRIDGIGASDAAEWVCTHLKDLVETALDNRRQKTIKRLPPEASFD